MAALMSCTNLCVCVLLHVMQFCIWKQSPSLWTMGPCPAFVVHFVSLWEGNSGIQVWDSGIVTATVVRRANTLPCTFSRHWDEKR